MPFQSATAPSCPRVTVKMTFSVARDAKVQPSPANVTGRWDSPMVEEGHQEPVKPPSCLTVLTSGRQQYAFGGLGFFVKVSFWTASLRAGPGLPGATPSRSGPMAPGIVGSARWGVTFKVCVSPGGWARDLYIMLIFPMCERGPHTPVDTHNNKGGGVARLGPEPPRLGVTWLPTGIIASLRFPVKKSPRRAAVGGVMHIWMCTQKPPADAGRRGWRRMDGWGQVAVGSHFSGSKCRRQVGDEEGSH